MLSAMAAWTGLRDFDRWQRRHAAAAFPVAVVRKFLDDRASNLAALIAYYAFFSLFPLLLALVSALGFVLQDNPSLQEEVLDSALARIPVIGAQLGTTSSRWRAARSPSPSDWPARSGPAWASRSRSAGRSRRSGTSRGWSSAAPCRRGCAASSSCSCSAWCSSR